MRIALRLASGLAAAALALMFYPPSLRAAAETDRKAPSIQLKTLGGKSVRLADLRGRIVLIDFWASWCAPCKATFPALNALGQELKANGVDVLAVSEDEKRKELDAFLGEHPPTLDVLLDPGGNAAAAFGVTAIPSMFVIDRAGVIRFSHANYGADVIEAVRAEILTLAGSLTGVNSTTPQLHNAQ